MKSKCLIIIAIILAIQSLSSEVKSQNMMRDSIDVLHYSICLNITEFVNRRISGYTDLQLVSKAKKMRFFNLDLQSLVVDSVKINDTTQNDYAHNDTTLTITALRPLRYGDTINVRVFYQGTPPIDANWGGFIFSSNDAFNMGVGMASKPPCFGRAWFPCNDNFTDKATYDYHITVKNRHKAVCSGTLKSVMENKNGTSTYFWSLKNEIPTYLSSVAVSNYVVINDAYEGIESKIPISLYVTANNKANAEKSFVNLKKALRIYEDCFGAYRWERVGYVQVSFRNGAMEHATSIAFPQYAIDGTLEHESTLVHELAHSWFGNLVTCKNEEDMWLNEGWASFCVALFVEKMYGADKYKEYMRENHYNVLLNAFIADKGYRALFALPHEYTYGRTVYDKGADVVYTLRNYLGDEMFFEATKEYLSTFAFQNVTTDEFCRFMIGKAGADLKPFLDFWVYSAGFPHFSIDNYNFNKKNNELSLTIRQRMKGTKDLAKENKLEIGFLDDEWNLHFVTMKVNGEITTLNQQLVFKPLLILLDPNEKITDATTDTYKIINEKGEYEFKNTFFNMKVEKMNDSAFIHVEHNWIAPEKRTARDLFISNDRYWRIDGILPRRFSTVTKFSFNLSYNLDNSLMAYSSGQMVLLYRKDTGEDWKIIPSKLCGGQMAGYLETTEFRLGEYTIGFKK